MKYLYVLSACFVLGCASPEPLEPKYTNEGCKNLETDPSYAGECLKMGDFEYPYNGCLMRPVDCILPYGAISTEKIENNIFCCK